MSKHTITAFYDSREYANNAVLMLRQAGIPDGELTVSPESAATAYSGAAEPQTKGFWASLEEAFGGSDDHHAYAEGVRRGAIMVTARVDDAKVDEAIEILDQHGTVDLDEREATWRSEGWRGGATVTGGGVADQGARPLRSMTPATQVHADTAAAGVLSTPSSQQAYRASTPVAAAGVSGGDDVIQVAEESITVGKRAVNRGKVRIHSSVVETPFSQQVNLRDETVSVERRPVDRPLGAAALGADLFQDRTVEVEEMKEEAVVAKTARVVEEIGIRKVVADRAETVTDTLRKTHVDIEDTRAAAPSVSLFADTDAIQRAKDMKVIGSDGQHVGVVDHVDGTTIKLKRTDPVSGGSHHLIPTDWVQSVDSTVVLKISAAEAKSRWTAA
ncbi:DUF2171 domain-containing protein [Lichenihabitans sp. Uapishka_5]|uniref:DUF2171 domain-containing protein n=1 Tax=Lichenihabitans sp. Uapishka_5 TaxID=3037302 RepID=UPI0029E7F7A3|nr:DUF2382 domain-containing protein [Lichenihabitans sp. Uapishka_5]MDX7951228.1 DUF2171 domain-containing protein [Lichenihabitans sp. Uapishka_5]